MTRPQRFVIPPGEREGLEVHPDIADTVSDAIRSRLDSRLIRENGIPDL
jgi:hypothetical protein